MSDWLATVWGLKCGGASLLGRDCAQQQQGPLCIGSGDDGNKGVPRPALALPVATIELNLTCDDADSGCNSTDATL
jgi:hypothetical protein